jgi:hypothetical protein
MCCIPSTICIRMQTTSLNHPQMTWKIVTSGFFSRSWKRLMDWNCQRTQFGIWNFHGSVGAYGRRNMWGVSTNRMTFSRFDWVTWISIPKTTGQLCSFRFPLLKHPEAKVCEARVRIYVVHFMPQPDTNHSFLVRQLVGFFFHHICTLASIWHHMSGKWFINCIGTQSKLEVCVKP